MSHNDLQTILTRIDGKGYKAYHDIKGSYHFPKYSLTVDYVQGDPFAVPSRLRARVKLEAGGFPPNLYSSKIRETAFRDFIGREFNRAIEKFCKGNRGIGKSGVMEIDFGGQEVLERTSVMVDADLLEVRFFVGLPARGRTILGRQAQEIFFKELPVIIEQSMFYENLCPDAIRLHVETVEDAKAMRDQLDPKGLAAFVGNGSLLPRLSGIENRPLEKGVPFCSPPEFEVTLNRPNSGPIKGMGISRGVTLIVGGGFHGKSTLLKAVELGVYNHIPGDGREFCVTLDQAVKIRAEDGRRVEKVNISSFINNLHFGRDTSVFCTDNASGSTSQAANIIEALEMEAGLLLIDEDTSATNFMIRDKQMQELVKKEKEPITPFIDRIRQLYTEHGVSTILVMGGSGDYFQVADTVIMMDSYQPVDMTEPARAIAKNHASRRQKEEGKIFEKIVSRRPLKKSFDPSKGKREIKIQIRGTKIILFGKEEIDLSYLEQLIDPSQARAIGLAIHSYSSRIPDSGGSLREGLKKLMAEVEQKGPDAIASGKAWDIAMPRIFELAGAINRMRSLCVE